MAVLCLSVASQSLVVAFIVFLVDVGVSLVNLVRGAGRAAAPPTPIPHTTPAPIVLLIFAVRILPQQLIKSKSQNQINQAKSSKVLVAKFVFSPEFLYFFGQAVPCKS
jgi:hypothetical protein